MNLQEQEKRIEQLESKVAFQEDSIETLHDEIFAQQKKIVLLAEQLTLLATKLKEAQPHQLASEKEEVPPPHY